MSAYEEVPSESGSLRTIVAIFAVPLRPVPRYLRSMRSFAGSNPLKWALVALAAVGYLLAIVLYTLFALFPAVSYALLILLTLPFIVAVYAWKGLVRLFGSRRAATGAEAVPATTTTRRTVDFGRQQPA